MPARLQLQGQRFGRLVALRDVGRSGQSRLRLWLCECECGKMATVASGNLRSGHTQSCGCIQYERCAEANTATKTTHGMTDTLEYATWTAMKTRCLNPNASNYHLYGSRGITICPEWIDSFEAFYADMGPRPSPDYSIDRIDNDGPYSPDNCRWATQQEQRRNSRQNVMLTYNGRTMCVVAWAEQLGLGCDAIRYRLRHGWPTEKVLAV